MTKAMTVGEVIEILQKVDPNTPFHYRGSVGEFPPLVDKSQNPYAPVFGTIQLARWNSNQDNYFVRTNDPFYKKNINEFEEPFTAVTFW